MEKIYRNHPILILESFIKSSWKFIIPMCFIAFKDITQGSLWVLVALVPMLLFTLIYSFLSWRKNTYYFSDKYILIQTGLFKVAKKQILFERVQTFDILEPLFYRPFGIVVLKIDTGNTSEEGSDITLNITRVQVEVLRKQVFHLRPDEVLEAEGVKKRSVEEHRVKLKEIFMLGATNNNLWMGIVALGTLYKVFDDYLEGWLDIDWHFLENQISRYRPEKIGSLKFLGILVMILLGYAIISTLFGIVGSYLKYGDFRVMRVADEIKIDYGLLNKKHYQFPFEKINAVYFRQNLVQSLFGYQKICIEIIGYGNESGEEALLYPLVKRSNTNQVMRDILPELLYEEKIQYVQEKTAIKFILNQLIWRGLILLIPLALIRQIPATYRLILGAILILDGLLVGYSEYRHTAIGIGENLIFLSYKGRGREEVVLPIKKIESFELMQTLFQKKSNLMNYRIHVWSNGLKGHYKIKNLDKEYYEDKLLNL